ncbi:MAG TPA: cupredoxin domain-containing protein [Candidatus Paceibacterota bacterium]
MDEKKKIIIEVVVGVVVLIVVVVIIVYALHGKGGAVSNATQPSNRAQSTSTPLARLAALTSSTTAAVPAGTVAPNKGSTSTPSNVAVPVVQGPGSPSGDVSYRSFNISIDGSAYSPNTVIVKTGDTVNLEMTAVDANYAFTLPQYHFNDPIAKGKTQTIQFQASGVGDFTFYCGSCGGPSKGPVGHLIVTAD